MLVGLLIGIAVVAMFYFSMIGPWDDPLNHTLVFVISLILGAFICTVAAEVSSNIYGKIDRKISFVAGSDNLVCLNPSNGFYLSGKQQQ